MFDPDIVVELFVFDPEGSSDAIQATAGQLEDKDQGMATDEDALETPSSSGE
jgi:hypothetical protein